MHKQNKILITGGLHGDEPTGVEVASYFLKNKLGVKGLVCNKKAITMHKRFTETDLNRSFKVKTPISYEERLAVVLSKTVYKYKIIIDIHNTRASGTTCAIVVNKPNNLQLMLAKYFGFNKLVVMPPSGSLISLKPSSSISIEVANDAVKKYSTKMIVDKIANLPSFDVGKFNKEVIKTYTFVNKVLAVTLDNLGLTKDGFSNFKKLTNDQANRLGLDNAHYYPIFLKKDENEDVSFTLVKEFDVKY